MIFRSSVAALAALVALTGSYAAIVQQGTSGPAALTLTRLDCGTIEFKDFNAFFSDASELPSGPRTGTDSCYLIDHDGKKMLWDTGLPEALIGKPNVTPQLTARLDRTIVDQLKQLGIVPGDIDVVGISHEHFDHVGQARAFPGATLVIGKSDFENTKGANDPFAPWRAKGAKVETVSIADKDIFGDGSVVAIRTPGHTGDHLSLLVRLASGPVLLTGDLYHSTLARSVGSVPPFNTDRADTLASMDRFEDLARSLRAKVIVQHEPDDIAKLPAFPAASR